MARFTCWYVGNDKNMHSFKFSSDHRLQQNRAYSYGCSFPIIEDALKAAERIEAREDSIMHEYGFGGFYSIRKLRNDATGYSVYFSV